MKASRKRILLAGIGVVVAAGIALSAYWRERDSVVYQTVPLERGTVQATVSATGTCNAVTTVEVGSQVSGNVLALYADFNSRVREGQLVARIDPQPFQARVNQAEAGLDAARAAVANARATPAKSDTAQAAARASLADAKANVAKAEAAREEANITLERQRALFREGVVATQDRDSAQATYDSSLAARDSARAEEEAAADNLRETGEERNAAQAELAAAEAQFQEARATLQQAQIDLAHTYIYAPVGGTVISRNVDAGQTVAASFQAPTLFVIAQDLTKMKVDTNVDEADIGKVRDGQAATFTVDAFPRLRFSGQVVQIREAPINIQNVVTYDVVIAVPNPELKLLPGMTANVSIVVADCNNVVKIPEAALRFEPPALPAALERRVRGLQQSEGQIVWVLDKNGQLRPVAVEVGISDGTNAVLVRGNLRAGDRVIVGVAAAEGSQANAPFGRPGLRL